MDVTFVFPCLNEERFIADCIRRVRASLDEDPSLKFEIVVADNGSTDRSREIAEERGARVVPVPSRGYGAALRGGITAAQGKYVLFADADGTYLYEDALRLFKETAAANADMGIASRLNGRIEAGAMPPLHRYLGTPVLTGLINVLFKGKLSDCNSGFRCVKKEAFTKWEIRSSGMEFASELLIKALKHDAKTVEISSGLRPPPQERHPHLRTWRDGMRHLLFIFSECPALFERAGLAVAIIATALQLAALVTGPINVAGLNIFDLHSKALLLLAGLVGTQFFVFGCTCYLKSTDRPGALSRILIGMDEGVLFFLLASVLVAIVAMVGVLFFVWIKSGFGGLHLANWLISFVHFTGVLLVLCLGVLGIHVLKRYEWK